MRSLGNRRRTRGSDGKAYSHAGFCAYDLLIGGVRKSSHLAPPNRGRLPEGIGSVLLFGSGDYAMRLWPNPQRIGEPGLTADDVVNAVRRQNVQVAAGLVNGLPYSQRGELQLPINVDGRLSEPDQFGQIVIKNNNGVVTRLSDVARVEIDASAYSLRSLLDNQQAVAVPIFQAPGSNAIEISNRVRVTIEDLKAELPRGLGLQHCL